MSSGPKLLNINFLLFSQGLLVSLLGSNLRQVAWIYLIAEITDSPLFLGTTSMIIGICCLLTRLILVNLTLDVPRRITLICCDLINGILALCFAVVVLLWRDVHFLIYPALIIFPLSREIINSLYLPISTAFIADLSHQSQQAKANATINSIEEAAHIVGKGGAGIIYRILGPIAILAIDGFSHLFCAMRLKKIRIEEVKSSPENPRQPSLPLWVSTKKGFQQLFNLEGIRSLLLLDAGHWLLTAPIFTLLPFFIKDPNLLNCHADWYGYFFATWAFGSFLGFWLTALYPAEKSKALIALIIFGEGLGLIMMASFQNPWPCLLIFLVMGVSSGMLTNWIQTIIQTKMPKNACPLALASALTICKSPTPLSIGLGGLGAKLMAGRIDHLFSLYGLSLITLSVTPIIPWTRLITSYRHAVAFKQWLCETLNPPLTSRYPFATIKKGSPKGLPF